ncbi:hypothetical protein BC827DRAFT_832896 [Russula dissimulans]|nr:hypothetical protein BC827DRAFT_832896 [Russula dissimulans]
MTLRRISINVQRKNLEPNFWMVVEPNPSCVLMALRSHICTMDEFFFFFGILLSSACGQTPYYSPVNGRDSPNPPCSPSSFSVIPSRRPEVPPKSYHNTVPLPICLKHRSTELLRKKLSVDCKVRPTVDLGTSDPERPRTRARLRPSDRASSHLSCPPSPITSSSRFSPPQNDRAPKTPSSLEPLTRRLDQTNVQASPGLIPLESQTRGRRLSWAVPLALEKIHRC